MGTNVFVFSISAPKMINVIHNYTIINTCLTCWVVHPKNGNILISNDDKTCSEDELYEYRLRYYYKKKYKTSLTSYILSLLNTRKLLCQIQYLLTRSVNRLNFVI